MSETSPNTSQTSAIAPPVGALRSVGTVAHASDVMLPEDAAKPPTQTSDVILPDHSDIAQSASPPPNPIQQLLSTLSDDGKQIWEDAQTGLKAEVDGAFALIGKALGTAAGQATALPTPAEAAAVQLVVDNVPTTYQPVVQGFLTSVVSGAAPALNAAEAAGVQKGLVAATAWLSGLNSLVDRYV